MEILSYIKRHNQRLYSSMYHEFVGGPRSSEPHYLTQVTECDTH